MNVNDISLKQALVILVVLFGGVIALAGFLAESMPESPRARSQSAASSKLNFHVSNCARDRVKLMLKAPATAKFPWKSGDRIEKTGENTYKISSYVDAQNSFGAMIRTYFTCNVTTALGADSCTSECTFVE